MAKGFEKRGGGCQIPKVTKVEVDAALLKNEFKGWNRADVALYLRRENADLLAQKTDHGIISKRSLVNS